MKPGRFHALLVLTMIPLAHGSQDLAPIQFKDVTAETGIDFIHTDGSSGRHYIVESVSSGIATFDYNGDGRIDILFLNGAPLPGSTASAPARNGLYRNEGNWRFTDVTVQSGLTDTNYHLGVCVGDYNNDGYPDIYLNNFGTNVLYRNNGNGTFTDSTAQAGVAGPAKVGAGSCFLDMDGDGDLDLFVGNYCNFDISKHQPRNINGFPAYAGPAIYGPTASILFRNNGNGAFTDVSAESGIASRSGTAMGVIGADYDDDGDTDIIVGNDAMANFVWKNDGHGKFQEAGLRSGLAFDANGIGLGTMGLECGDYNNDGKLDFQMTSYQKQWAILYRNEGRGFFADVTHASGAGNGTYNEVTWGIGFMDFDYDGFLDLFLACGHLQDNVHRWDDTSSFEARNILLRNSGNGKFVNISRAAGDGLDPKFSSRGAAFDDLDNDGDLDAVILNARAKPTLLRNDSPAKGHWIEIRPRGSRTNRDGIGARIKVVAGELTLIREVHSGRGYQSHYNLYPRFGLGSRAKVDRVEVRWIGGGTKIQENLPVDQIVEIRE